MQNLEKGFQVEGYENILTFWYENSNYLVQLQIIDQEDMKNNFFEFSWIRNNVFMVLNISTGELIRIKCYLFGLFLIRLIYIVSLETFKFS